MPHARRSRFLPFIATFLVLAAVMLGIPTTGSAWVLNQVQLDDGTCGHNLQIGSDVTASSSATPSFLLFGDGSKASYAVKIDGASIGTFSSDMFANVCIQDTTTLAQGAHTLTASELAPTPSNSVTPFKFSVDTVAPSPPSMPALASYSDSGVVGDNLTKFNNPALVGTAPLGASVIAYDAGAPGVGGAIVDSTGHWTIRTIPLANGTHPISVRAEDEAGNLSSATGALQLRVDTTPPSVPQSLHVASTTASSIALAWNPSTDNLAMRQYDVYRNGVKIATVTSPTTTWTDVTVSQGVTYAYYVIAEDTAGNASAASNTINASTSSGTTTTTASTTTTTRPATTTTTTRPATTTTTTRPATTTTTTTTIAANLPGAPTITSAVAGNNTVTLTWNAPVNNGGSAIVGYRVYRSTTSGAETLLWTLGNVSSFTDTNAFNGTRYYYKVTARNAVGDGAFSNEVSATPSSSATTTTTTLPPTTTTTRPPTTTTTIPVIKPVVTLTKINGTVVQFPYWTRNSVSSLGGTCGTGPGDSATVVVSIGTSLGTAPCSAGNWTYNTSLTAQGSYVIVVTQSNTSGGVGTSGSKTVNIDTTAPAVTNVVLANRGSVVREAETNDTVTITFSEPLKASTLCNGWVDNGSTQTVTGVSLDFSNGSGNDRFVADNTPCGGASPLQLGTVYTGGNYVAGNATFTSSSVVWSPTARTLTVTLGALSGGKVEVASTVSAPQFQPGNVTDLAGNPISAATFTAPATSTF